MPSKSGTGTETGAVNSPPASVSSGVFHLSLLGPFTLTGPDGQAIEIASRKNRLLLAMLASAPGRSLSRDALAGMLWADHGEEQARNSLRQALAVLRKDLKGRDTAFFAALDSSVTLSPDLITLDTESFQNDVRRGTRESLQRAIGLWRGAFLADVSVSEAELEQWLTERREHYSNRYIAAMDWLVPLLDNHARIDMARRLVQADNLREASHRHLMAAYLAAGERAQALRHYESVRKLLKEELGVEPSTETQELRNRIAATGNGTAAMPAMPPPVAGQTQPPSATQPVMAAPPVASAPVRLYQAIAVAIALLGVSLGVWIFTRPAPEPVTKPSVAILPFESLSGGAEDARIAEALTVDTITDLSRFWDFRVMAKDTTDAYKGGPADIRKLGEELKVGYALKGTFQRESGHVRVTAQLVDTANSAVLWSDRYDRPAGEIFAIQSDVADHIANSVGSREGTLHENMVASARRKRPSDLGAFEIYLLAQATMHSDLSPEHMREGQKLLLQAIEMDPTFARAYVKYAHGNSWRITYESDVPALIQEAIKYARKGVELDPMDADAHSSLGYTLTLSGDLAQGEAQFNEALRINPNAFDLLAAYSCMAHNYGKPERGAESTDRAIALNPNYPNWSIPCLRLAVFMVGRYVDALRIQSRQPENEMNTDGFVVMAGSLAALGRMEEAKGVVQRGLAKYPGLLSIERFAFNRGWSPSSAKILADHMSKAGFPVCATSEELADTLNPVRLPECAG